MPVVDPGGSKPRHKDGKRHKTSAGVLCVSKPTFALVHREIVVVQPYMTARLIALILIKGTEDDAEPWDGRM